MGADFGFLFEASAVFWSVNRWKEELGILISCYYTLPLIELGGGRARGEQYIVAIIIGKTTLVEINAGVFIVPNPQDRQRTTTYRSKLSSIEKLKNNLSSLLHVSELCLLRGKYTGRKPSDWRPKTLYSPEVILLQNKWENPADLTLLLQGFIAKIWWVFSPCISRFSVTL